MGVNVCSRSADGPHQRRQVLMYMWNGQGLTIQRPSPHGHHERDRVDQAALVKCQQLEDSVVDLDVCNLYVREWQCKFLLMVLQYRQLCFSNSFVKCVFSISKFCLYIVCIKLTYFKKFPDCIYLFVHQNSRQIRSYTYNVAVLPGHSMQMRPKLRCVVCRCPDAARGVKCSGDRGKGGHEPSSSAESQK